MSDAAQPMLEISGLNLTFRHGLHQTQVLKDVGLSVERGRTVGLVGESGSGKSTIAKAIVGIHRPDNGSIVFDGTQLVGADRQIRRSVRRRIQLIPQDPYSSLDPRRTIGQTLAEAIDPVRARARPHRARILDALSAVALDASTIDRYPHEFSGGQRQRIAIARALVTEPDLIIADEITSALDVSTQAEILTLLAGLRDELNLTVLFISHNLAVVRKICDEVVVLLHGEVVEAGLVEQIFTAPKTEYTHRLIASVPGGPEFSLDVSHDDTASNVIV